MTGGAEGGLFVGRAERELVKIGLANADGAGGAQLGDNKSIGFGDAIMQDSRARGRQHAPCPHLPGRKNSCGGWKLIISRQTGQWGTEYDPAQDLARIPMRTRTLPSPVEQLTIGIEPRTRGGVLRVQWDTTEAYTEFGVR